MALLAGRYEVKETLGKGGIGEVHLVADRLNGGRLIALKQIRADTLSDGALSSIAREFRLLTHLRHPNLVEVYDFALRPECHLTMEHVRGVPWHEAGLDAAQQIDAAIQLCRALAHIHARGLVHLDVKPQNVLLEGRTVKLMDFGVARDPRDREGFGFTHGFAAPEVICGEAFDHRADLFSVGMLLGLGETVAGPTTHTGELGGELGTANTEGLSPELRAIVDKLTAVDPNDRYPDADAVRDALEALAHERRHLRRDSHALLQTNVLVSRDDVLAKLRTAPSGSAFCVVGPRGCGKTRLLAELKASSQLAGDLVVSESGVRQRGEPLAIMRRTLFQLAGLALVPAPELLKPLLGETSHASALQGADAQKPLLAAAVEYTLRVCDRARVVLLVDDAAAVDATSRAYLSALAEARRPGLFLVVSDALHGCEPLALPPFGPGDGPALVESLFAQKDALPAPVAERLCAQAGGDAALLFELLRLAADKGLVKRTRGAGWRCEHVRVADERWPGSREEAAAARMQLLSAAERDLLACAALLGVTSDPDVLSRALAVGDVRETLSGLVSEGFLAAFGQRFGFASSETHHAAKQLAERRIDAEAFAAAAASALEAGAGPAEDIGRLWAKSQSPLRALPHYRRAADEALAVYDYTRAEAMLRAAKAIDPSDELRTRLAQVALWRGDFALAEAEALGASGADDAKTAALAQRLAGLAATSLGRLDDAIARLTLAASEFARLGDTVLQAQALNECGLAHMYAVRFDVALARHQEALRLLELAPHDAAAPALAATHDNLGFAYLSLGNYRASGQHLTAALALHREINDAYGEAVTHNHLGNMLRHQGDYDAAKAAYDRSLALCVRSGNQLREAITLNNLGVMCDEAGDFDGALALFARALAQVVRMQDRIREGDNIGCIGASELRAGRIDAAMQSLNRAVAIRRELNDFGYLVTDLSYRALAYLAKGDRPAARRDVDEALGMLQAGVFGVEQPQNVFLNAYDVLLALGDVPAAEQALTRGVAMVRAQLDTMDERSRVLAATKVRANRQLLAAAGAQRL